MKIDHFELFKVQPRWLFLKVVTDDGLTGWGEPVIEGRAETAADVLAFADTLGRLFPAHTNGLASAESPWRTAMEELACAGTTGTTETTGTKPQQRSP